MEYDCHIFLFQTKNLEFQMKNLVLLSETLDFFSIWIFFKEHSRHTGQQG